MKKVILIYASATGKTGAIADAIISGFEQTNVEVITKDPFNTDPEELLNYDGILIGTYTWEGVIPDEFMDFYEELDYHDLTGKKAAIFGSGDSYYTDTYGAALELFEDKFMEVGAKIVLPKFLIELYPDLSEIEEAKKFAVRFSSLL